MKKIIFLMILILGNVLLSAQQNQIDVSFLKLPLYSNKNRLNWSSAIDFNNHSLIFLSNQKDWFCYTENKTNQGKCEYLNFVMHVVRVGEREFAVAYTAFESTKKDSNGYPDIGFKANDQGNIMFYRVDFRNTEMVIGAGSYVKNGKKYKKENYQTYSLDDLCSLLRSKNTLILLPKDQEKFKNGINTLITGIETYYPSFTNQNYGYIERSSGTYVSSENSNVNYNNKSTRSSYSNGDNVTLTGTLRHFSEVKQFGAFSGETIHFYVLELSNLITVGNMKGKQIQLNIINNDNIYKKYINKKVIISGSLRIPDTANWQRDIVLDDPRLQ
jgi:hypothetical protein